MPRNLHALIRYQTIDYCLRRPGMKWTKSTLAKACGDALREKMGVDIDTPAERTIFKDLANMKSGKLGYRAPIVFDRRLGSYKYTDPGFSISGNPVRKDDLVQLLQVKNMLGQIRGLHHPQWLSDLINRVSDVLDARNLSETVPLQFDTTFSEGWEWLSQLFEAAVEKYPLRLLYHPFTEARPLTKTVSPYLIREYNNRWFLIGYEEEAGRIRTFALDRIQEAEKTLLHKFHRLPGFVPEHWLRQVVGVSIPDGGRIEKVRLRVCPEQAPYLRTKPLHHSQREETSNEKGCIFSLEIIPNFELESHLLALGERVEVLEPLALRNRLKERLSKAAGQYG